MAPFAGRRPGRACVDALPGRTRCDGVLAVGFAVHYVRLDVRHSGLQFPGSEPPQFLDYLYFAVSVATTFGTTDVNVTDRLLRRTVTGQAVLAFAFNTVILALVLAALGP